ncbi:MAG: sensor histidine kinase [Bacteroidetes bacterium]|nr:sensor histidine kinase [Bacteroidota bacterium]
MKNLSLHILDIIQNSIRAKANLIELEILENLKENIFQIVIKDNGTGIEKDKLKGILDPYFTSRTTRNVGLGLSLLKQNAERTGGFLKIYSKLGKGTVVKTLFKYNNIDRPVLGDISGVVTLVVASNPSIEFLYKHKTDKGEFFFNSKEIKRILENVAINEPKVIFFLKEMIKENLQNIKL